MPIPQLLLFIAVNALITCFTYYKSNSILLSAFISAPASTIILSLIGYIHSGYMDPFIIFGFFLSLVYCFILSLLIASGYKVLDKKIHKSKVDIGG